MSLDCLTADPHGRFFGHGPAVGGTHRYQRIKYLSAKYAKRETISTPVIATHAYGYDPLFFFVPFACPACSVGKNDRIGSGSRVGVFHWPHYDREANRTLNREICRLIDNFAVTQISAYQSAKTTTLTLCNPLLAKHIIDGLPKFQFERLVVLQGELGDVEVDLESLLRQGSQE